MANSNNIQTMTDQPSKKKNLWFISYKNMNINQKISFLLTIISFVAVIIIGVVSFYSSKSSLKNVALEQLISITEIKKRSLENYFDLVRKQIQVLSQDQMIVEAMGGFLNAYKVVDVDATAFYSGEDFENMKAHVRNFYNTSFITPLNNNLNINSTVDSYWTDNLITTILQYIYISNNPNPIEGKSLLNRTADGSTYSTVHSKYHPNIRDFAEKFDIEDIYLIDEKDGNVVYSVSKKVDFGTNILTGPFKESGLALAYEVVKNSNIKDFSYMTDMKFHKPSLGVPSVFISASVYNETEKIGVIVFQISSNNINKIVSANKQWEKEGLGKTGETYIVGDDDLIRSDIRMLSDNKNEYLESIRFMDTKDEDIDKINKLNTSILVQRVNTEASSDAINGRTGEKVIVNYLGKKVLSAYSPLNLQDVNWGIISEIQTGEIYQPIKSLRSRVIVIIVILLIIIYFSGNYLANIIAKRITIIKDSINKLASGETISKFDNDNSDEIGLTVNAVNQLILRLEEVSNFANAIGKGDFAYNYHASSANDKLGNSLIEMKKSLEEARLEEERRMVEDEKRNWATQGIAKFGEILRSNNDNIDNLSYNIISNLIDYLKANQGGIFLIEDEDQKDVHIKLIASYAFNRQKFIKKRIEQGEGLIGTCILEKKTVHLTEIPDDYINITSGLGDANPNAILIVPLKTEEIVLGVIEIATFEKFNQHEIEFVEKLADSIASTITSVKINAKTAKLLTESNEKANALTQQEEEMRQNLEELKATQEEMARIKKDEEKKEQERKEAETKLMAQLQESNETMKLQAEELIKEKSLLDAILNNLPDYLYFKDLECKFIKNSLSHAKAAGFNNPKDMIGKSDFDFHGKEAAKKKYDEEQQIIKTGKAVVDIIEHDILPDGTEEWVSTTKMPLYTEDGKCIGTFGISKNITEFKMLEIEANMKNEELQAQEEELRQNLEEMQTIQEELSKRTYLMDALLNNLPDHIYFKDENSKFIECSASMQKLFKVNKKEDLLGKSDFDFFDEEHARPAYNDEQQIIKTGKAMVNKIEKEVHKDGRVTYVSTTKLPLRNEEGKIVGTFGISTDISDHKLLQDELAKEKMLLDALLYNLPATIYFKDAEGRFLRVSTSLIPKFQVNSIDEIIGKTDFDFHGKKHAQESFEDEQRIMKTKKPVIDLIEKEQFDDGRLSWGSTSKMPLYDQNGNVIGTFGITSDVTKLMMMKEELEKFKGAGKELDKIMKTKEELNKLRKDKK